MHHEEIIWDLMILQYHDMLNFLDTQNPLPFVLLLNKSDVFLYILYSHFLEHNIDLNKYFDILHCIAFQPFVLEKHHSHNHQKIPSIIWCYIFFINIVPWCTKWRNIDLWMVKDRKALWPVQIDPSCKILSKGPTTHW